ncbi:MAG: PEGA domain-containing protein, partial [Myxococcales bacterium]|nr:PEGA domain-containing protein [Myxococcales bacterium]
MARALVIAAGCMLAPLGGAMAGPRTSKVTIETDPPGAKVYFNLKEDGEVCTTPCTIDAPIGETPIIIEAENRRSIIENLLVPKKTARPMKVSYKLEAALGSLIVEGGAGATIKIDDEDHGTAPRRLDDLPAGAHHVVLERDGKTIYDEFVEIEAGHEATVTPTVAPAPPTSLLDAPPSVTEA